MVCLQGRKGGDGRGDGQALAWYNVKAQATARGTFFLQLADILGREAEATNDPAVSAAERSALPQLQDLCVREPNLCHSVAV